MTDLQREIIKVKIEKILWSNEYYDSNTKLQHADFASATKELLALFSEVRLPEQKI